MKYVSSAAIAAAILLGACAARQPIPTGTCCAYGVQVADRLYFGRDIPGGRDSVTEARWSEFVKTVIAPAFPNSGWTVYRAEGAWYEPASGLTLEKTFVLEKIHVLDARSDSVMNHIARAYISEFRQFAVLRLKVPAQMSLIERPAN
jgi:hypothetical protein